MLRIQCLRSAALPSARCAAFALSGALRFAGTSATVYKSSLPTVLPLLDQEPTLYHYMRKRWESVDPKKVALIQAETGQQITYGELNGAAAIAAQVLYHIGEIRKDDVVCVAMLNTILYGPLCYGILRVGGTISTVNAVGAPSTLAYHFKTNKCKVVLGMKFFQKSLEVAVNIAERETGNKIKIFYPEDFMKMPQEELLKLRIPKDYEPLKDAKPDDTVFIPFSSGTTGLPKGVQLTNRNLIANMEQVRKTFGTTPDEVSISVLPFFHIFGFTCCLNAIMTAGGTQVVMMKYSVESFTDVIAKYKVTMSAVAPPILVSLIKSQETFAGKDLSSLQVLRSGSAPLSAELEHACEKMLPGCSVAQGYGMTEMSPVISAVPRNWIGGTRVYGGGGVLAPDTEVRIIKIDDSQQSGADKSSGVDCAAGEEGEIWARGPQMMKGYLHAEDTAVTMQDGWYRTGDIGTYDAAVGQLLVTDRLKELIKYKGFQVSPASMEALILQHPWVQDCIVVGVPDPRDLSFENPRALVVLKPSINERDAVCASDELYRYVMTRNPPHKRLHGGVRIMDVIPRNEAGKVMRRQIRTDEVAFMKQQIADDTAAASAAAGGDAAAA